MIVHPNGSYEQADWFTADTYPDSYFIDESTEEGKALAEKIASNYPYYNLVIADGELVDVMPTERPPALPPEPTSEQRIATLEAENAELRSRVSDVEPRLGDVEMALADLFTV